MAKGARWRSSRLMREPCMLEHGITPGNALFLVFVTLAVYAQNLTGFALALILLGLVGATELFPLPDVVNVASIITLVNAALFLYRRRALRLERPLWPVLLSSMAGTVVGVAACHRHTDGRRQSAVAGTLRHRRTGRDPGNHVDGKPGPAAVS
jgi:hypothetical protein